MDMAETPSAAPALYGSETLGSLQHFGASGRRLGDVPDFVRNYALIKLAAARVNASVGKLDATRAEAIVAACQEVVSGRHLDQFPTALVLGGGGTTTNMNVNEVLARRATQLAGVPVHPNDHVNASQSTNDTFPTAVALTLLDLVPTPAAALNLLARSLDEKAQEFASTPYLGRTCLQDAVTLSAGQTLQGQARAVARGAAQLVSAVSELASVPLGATVLGTSIGAPSGFADECVADLCRLTGHPLSVAGNFFDAMAHLDPLAAVADAGSRAAITVAKVASDIRLRASGPGGGFAEVTIPKVQAGSSIMPGKVNPAVPEYAMQLSFRVRGAAHTVGCAVAAGELELNVMEPVIVDALLGIFDDLTRAATAMAQLCVQGLVWDGLRRAENVSHAVDPWIELAEEVGYDEATRQTVE